MTTALRSSRISHRSLPFVLGTAALLAAAVAAYAGGAHCAEQHTQADYQSMAEKMAKKGWMGIETESAAGGGWAIKTVVPGSPAEKAGLKAGDVLVALNGVRFADENKEALGKVKSTLGPGKQVTYTVARKGAEQQIAATLAEVPREVLATWVGEHVLDHTSYQVASN